MPKYKALHTILHGDKDGNVKQHDLGAIVDQGDFDKPSMDRLLKSGSLAPLEGTEDSLRPFVRPDQGDDPTPRGAVSPDWFAARTPAEIDAEIAALQAQRESAVDSEKKRAEAEKAVSDAKSDADPSKPVRPARAGVSV